LLQKEFKLTLQSFKSGRDGGIDLRYSRIFKERFIVQCKHYAGSTYNTLFRHLSSEELPKVKKLRPKKYILVTSLGLTPANKDELRKLFHPFCKTADDIYGNDDLNNLLGKFPDIEKKHFKLWLTSQTVLDAIVHSKVHNRSIFEVDYIKKKIQYYVQNKS